LVSAPKVTKFARKIHIQAKLRAEVAEGAGGSKPKAFVHFGIEKEPLGIAGEVAETVSRALQGRPTR